MKIINPSIELIWITPDPEIKIENVGRTCYKSENKITKFSATGFVQRMRKSGHHAMLEHASASFRIITDRGISHEIVRHRIASYAQESTRYCNYSKDKFGNECSFILPPDMTAQQNALWTIACIRAEQIYFDMLIEDCLPQIARSVLPNCLKTEIVMTANFREWRHFITLRLSKAAHPQIRPIARQICNILFNYAPSIFGDLHEKPKI
jgi:thymidylate synthase (FAD)